MAKKGKSNLNKGDQVVVHVPGGHKYFGFFDTLLDFDRMCKVKVSAEMNQKGEVTYLKKVEEYTFITKQKYLKRMVVLG